MKVRVAHDFSQKLHDQVVHYMRGTSRKDDGLWHVSDMLSPRKGIYRKLFPDREPAQGEIDMFVSGVAFHEFLQKVLGAEFAEARIPIIDGVVGTIDWLGDALIELKTSRKWTIPEMPEEHYVDQARAYCAGSARDWCYIVVVYFTAGRNPWKGTASTLEIVSWRVDFSKGELSETREELKALKDRMDQALAAKEPRQLNPCIEWMCGGVYKGEIKRLCQFYKECQPEGLYPETELLKKLGKK